MDQAWGLARDAETGALYVLTSDPDNSAGSFVLVLEADGTFRTVIPLPLADSGYLGLARDEVTGALYTYDYESSEVVRIDTDDATVEPVFATNPLPGTSAEVAVKAMAAYPGVGFVFLDFLGGVTVTDEAGGILAEFDWELGDGLSLTSGPDETWDTADDTLATASIGVGSLEPPYISFGVGVAVREIGVDLEWGTIDDVDAQVDRTPAFDLAFLGLPGATPSAIDPDSGRRYIYDSDAEYIHIFDADGTRRVGFSTNPSLAGIAISEVVGMAFDADAGELWLHAFGDGVYRVATDGTSVSVATHLTDRFPMWAAEEPVGLAYDPDADSLYAVSDFSTSTRILRLWAGDDGDFGTDDDRVYAAKLNYVSLATGVTWDATREALAVTSRIGGNLYWFDRDLQLLGFVSTSTAGIMAPSHLSVDTDGSYFVHDDATSRFYSLDFAGEEPRLELDLSTWFPTVLDVAGVAVGDDTLYVADADGCTVWRLSLAGELLGTLETMQPFAFDDLSDVAVDPTTGDIVLLDLYGLLTLTPDGAFVRYEPFVFDDYVPDFTAVTVDPSDGTRYLWDDEAGAVVALEADGTVSEVLDLSTVSALAPLDCVQDRGLAATTSGGFLFLCDDGGTLSINEVGPTGDLEASLTLAEGRGPRATAIAADADTGFVYYLAQVVGPADVEDLGVVDVRRYDAGDDGQLGTDDDGDIERVNLTGAFPHSVGTGGRGRETFDGIAYRPSDDRLLGLTGDWDELVTFTAGGTFESSIATDPLPSGEVLDQDAGIYWDDEESRLYAWDPSLQSLVTTNASGDTYDIAADFDALDLDCCYEGLTRDPVTGYFWSVRNTDGWPGGVAIIHPGEDPAWGSGDERLYELTLSSLVEAKDISYDALNDRFLIATEGDGWLRAVGRDAVGLGYWPLGVWTQLTEPGSLDVDPDTGDVWLWEDNMERVYRLTLP
jgi:DNA-binding beta-propeller fold protein YncE